MAQVLYQGGVGFGPTASKNYTILLDAPLSAKENEKVTIKATVIPGGAAPPGTYLLGFWAGDPSYVDLFDKKNITFSQSKINSGGQIERSVSFSMPPQKLGFFVALMDDENIALASKTIDIDIVGAPAETQTIQAKDSDKIDSVSTSVAGKSSTKIEQGRSMKADINFTIVSSGGEASFKVIRGEVEVARAGPYERSEGGASIQLEWLEDANPGDYELKTQLLNDGEVMSESTTVITVAPSQARPGEDVSHLLLQMKLTSPVAIFQGFNSFVIWLTAESTKLLRPFANAISGITGTTIVGVDSTSDTLNVYIDERSPLGPLVIPLLIGVLILIGVAVVAWTVTEIGKQQVEQEKVRTVNEIAKDCKAMVDAGTISAQDCLALDKAIIAELPNLRPPDSPFLGGTFESIAKIAPYIVAGLAIAIVAPPLINVVSNISSRRKE